MSFVELARRPGQVGLGDQRQLRRRGARKPAAEPAGGHVHQARLGRRRPAPSTSRAPHPALAEHLDDTLGQAVPLGHHDDPPAGRRPAGQVVQRAAPCRRGRSRPPARPARVRRRRPSPDRRRCVSASTANGPTLHHGTPRRQRVLADVGQRVEGRRAEHRLQVDRASRCRPRRSPSSRPGTPRWWPPGRAPGPGPARGRRPAPCAPSGSTSTSSSMPSTRAGVSDSMPSTAMPSATFSSRSATPGSCGASVAGPLADGVGEQQLAARRRPQPVLGDLEAALVGHREVADLLDRVAPEVHPQRVLLGRREDVQDAAAHGEVAAPLHQVGAGVGRGRPAGGPRRPGPPRRRWTAAPEPGRPARVTIGCSTARTGATTTGPAPAVSSEESGWASRRSTASRRPTVSLRGLSRSCGSVSHDGKSTTESGGRKQRSASARSSASRVVAVTASTGRPAARPSGRRAGRRRRARRRSGPPGRARRRHRSGPGRARPGVRVVQQDVENAGEAHEFLVSSWSPGCPRATRTPASTWLRGPPRLVRRADIGRDGPNPTAASHGE